MQIGHLMQSGLIVASAVFLGIKRRAFLKEKDNNYLIYWLMACAVWAAYYVFKGFGLISTHNGLATQQIQRGDIGVLLDFSANAMNSVLIMLGALLLSDKGKLENFRTCGLSGILVVLVTIASAIIICLIFNGLGASRTAWIYINAISSSFIAAMVLILFYARLARKIRGKDKLATFALWSFGGYAYLQGWYPYFFMPRNQPVIEWGLYGAACLLKISCTVVAFYSADLPAAQTGAQEVS